jgi:probable HAF family extracellular repeat protein
MNKSLLALMFPIFFGSSLAQAEIVITDIQAVDLGTLPGGTSSIAYDINEIGNIVGRSDTLSGETHAFYLPMGGVMQDLSTLSGGDSSVALGLNDNDQVVGRSNILNPITNNLVNHGFIWESGVIRDLGAYPPEDDINSSSTATAINNSGLISGSVDLAGVVWELGGTPNFPPFPPYVRVTDPGPFSPANTEDINHAGQAVGTLVFYITGFRWQAGVLESLVLLQPGLDTDAYGINELGEIAGRALIGPPIYSHAVFWPDPSTVHDLGTLGGDNSEAHDINDGRFIVGSSEMAGGETVAFIWHDDFGMQSLGTLGGANSKAYAINSIGQIVGESETTTGEVHATLWTVSYATSVLMDIKPGNSINPINPRSKGKLTIAILTSDDFDASIVDIASIRFGPDGAETVKSRIKDVDDDGDWDLVFKVKTPQTGIACGDTEATLTAQTLDGDAITGTDTIKTVGCNKN